MFVTKPDRHSSDIIIPGRTSDPDGFVTDHREIDGLTGPIKVYFSVTGLRQLAAKHREVGLVPVAEREALVEELARVNAELDQALATIASHEAREERIAGFVKDGFKVQKVQGRPPVKESK